jgi:hypothetical protein
MGATPGLGRYRALKRSHDSHVANVSNPHVVTAAQLGISGAFTPKGTIAAANQFPTLATVQIGWLYRVTTGVTDNDVAKTNTGQSFPNGHEIYWNGTGGATGWTDLGATYQSEECSATINVKTLGANALTAPGAAAQQFTPTEFIGIITAANAMVGDMAITIGTSAGGTQIAAITILTGLNTVGEKFIIHFDGLLPAIAGASALDISVTTADTGTTGTMTGILRGRLSA